MKQIFLSLVSIKEPTEIGENDMKRFVVFCIAIFATIQVTGCHYTADTSREKPQSTLSSTDTTSQTIQTSIDSTLYDITFWSYISKNPIDAEYVRAMESGDMNIGEIVTCYLDNWKNEFQCTVNNCDNFMDSVSFSNLQNEMSNWEEQILSYWQFKHELVFQSNASIYGTEFYQEFRLLLAEKYRDMTIDVKYLCFILETELDPTKYNSDLKSIQFSSLLNN